MVRGARNIWTRLLPAIATSMIAASGSAVRAAAQPQDQSQAPAGDSPFAILLAALSTQGMSAGEGADADASSDMAADLPPDDQAAKPIVAASGKSNADDHAAEAALAALLNTTATPVPFSPPAPEPETANPAPAMLANDGNTQPANAGANPQPDASTPLDPATSSVAGAPIDPANSMPGNDPAMPPSDDKARADARAADASDSDAGLPSKVQPEKKSAAADQSAADAARVIVAAAYAAAGQASTDQGANPAVASDTAQSLSVRTTPGIGAAPAKNLTSSGPAVTPSDSDDTDKQAATDMPPEFAGSIDALAAGKPAIAPVKSAGASAKSATNTQPATDASSSNSPDKSQILSAAHANPGTHAAASKTDAAAPSDDGAKLVQADSAANAVPAAAGATSHAAPPQPVAIVDPSAIITPHAASATSPGASPIAGFEITSAAADPVPDLNGFAVSIAARSLSGAKQFEIRLDPPELGRVDVRLSIDAAGKAVAHMATDQPQTLDLLRKDAPALTQALRDAGLDVSQNGLNFSLRGQDRQSGDDQSGTQGRKSSLSARLAIQAVQAPAALAYAGAALNARLDIHV